MIVLSPPGGALGTYLDRARLSVDCAQEHLYAARMADIARIVRDALPDAFGIEIDTNDLDVPPIGVVLHSIYATGGVELWTRGQELPEALAAYRTSNGTTWPDIVRHLEYELTSAMGADSPDTWWKPRDDRVDDGFYFTQLPTPDEIAAIQADQPHLLGAYLADRDASPFAGLWHAAPLARPTMSVAGVAITASLATDGVLTVDIDPTGTHPDVMPPAGPGTPVRVQLAATVADPPGPAARPGGGQEADDECEGAEEPAACRTEGCEEDPDDGEGWDGFCGNCADRRYAQETAAADPEQDTEPGDADTVHGEAQVVLAPTPDVPVTAVGALEDLESWFDGDGEMRYGTSTEDTRHDNGRRAGFAATAVLAYVRRTCHGSAANDEMPETVISDLLADLRHLSDALGLDFAETDDHGARHYEAELRGEI